MNASTGRWIDVSETFAEVLHAALGGAAATDGLFDPSVLAAIEHAGYDRDFRDLATSETVAPTAARCGGWRDIELVGTRLYVPNGTGLDLGGIAKGWTVDLAAMTAIDAGLRWVMVEAGGDLRIAGEAPALNIGIEEPTDKERTCVTVAMDSGALATTSVLVRRWGEELHHVIDPRIGRPARTPVVQATVWEQTCAAAEVASKRAVLEGVTALEDVTGALILATGEIVMNMGAAA